jgi:hypothetical protein
MSDDGDPVTPPRPRPRPGPVEQGTDAEDTSSSEVLPEAPIIEDVAEENSPEEPSADQTDASGVDPEAEPSADHEVDVSPEADSGSAASAPESGTESSSETETEPEPATGTEPEPETDGDNETEASVTGEAEAELPSEISEDDESGDTSVQDSSAVPTPPVAPGPVSAASRARRIGGRPAVSTGGPSQPGDGDAEPTPRRRPSPPPPGTGRHVAAPPAAPKKERAKKDRPAKESKAPKPARAPKEPKAGRDLSAVAWIPSFVLGAAALALVVIIAIAAHGVYYGKDSVSSGQRNAYQEQALAAAKTCLATINTYDYRKLDADEKSALACTTGTFTASLKATFDKTLKVKAPPAKAIQTAQVNEAGISEVTSNGKQVQILIYGQLAVTNVDTGSTPRYDPFGTVVTVDNVGGNWLIASYTSPTGS